MDIVGGQAATDGVGTNQSLLCSSGMTSCLSCCGESSCRCWQNKAMLSWCGDSGMTTVRAIVGAVVGVISMLYLLC